MKGLLLSASLACCCCNAFAQNTIDNYTTSTNTFTEIGNSAHGLNMVQDLDFVPGRPNEMWVLNKETYGGSVVIYFNPGQPNQTQQFRRDSHNEHFMAKAVALVFGDNNYFVTAQEIKSTADASSTFMGPALWSSDTAIFARLHQNDWVQGELLGSHIDMLHQSPYGMGAAHDHDNVYWYFDGHNGNICKYDFAIPHGVGEDDHSDGIIHRYTGVTVKRKANQPSHMVVDKKNSWLYYIDGGNNKVMRMKTTSGTVGADLQVPATSGEPLAEYKEVTGATVETIASSGLTAPVGIDYRKDRLLVSDYSTGNINIYNVAVTPATLVGTIITGGPGVMGVRIDDNNKIWYVNSMTKKVFRIDNANVLSVDNAVAKDLKFAVYPNPASNVLNISLDDMNGGEKATIMIYDMAGKQVYANTKGEKLNTINTSAWAKGIYSVMLSYNGAATVTKVTVQ